MPLPEPKLSRKLMHTRTVTCRGYERDDGLWDIEGHMTDTKNYNFPNQARGGEIKAGEPLHAMGIRLTLDRDFYIHDADACTDWAPFQLCPGIAARYKQLIGMHIKPGWNLKIKQLFNGINGCTHLTELLGSMATTAFQSIHGRHKETSASKSGEIEQSRIINSCHALRSDGDVVKQHWPQLYSGNKKHAVNES
jgi:hypothetical protein